MTTQEIIKKLLTKRAECNKQTESIEYEAYTTVMLELMDELEDEEYQTYAELVLNQKYTEPIKRAVEEVEE